MDPDHSKKHSEPLVEEHQLEMNPKEQFETIPLEQEGASSKKQDVTVEEREVSKEQAQRSPTDGSFSAAEFKRYERRLKHSSTVTTLSASTLAGETERSFKEASVTELGISRTQSRTTSKAALSTFSDPSTLSLSAPAVPEKRQGRMMRNVRHISFNVYRRLFSVVFISNMIAFVVMLAKKRHASELNLSDISTAASANLFVAIMIRQDYLVNFLYHMCWVVPHSTPLRLRRMLAKVYENGGIHSGAAVAGTIWFILLTALLTTRFVDDVLRSIPVLTISYILLVLFVAIIFFAYPSLRGMSHNTFEYVHRFAGWLSIGLFWAEILLLAHAMAGQTKTHMGMVLIKEPTFWFLVLITFHIILPWLRLRHVEFQPEKLSDHALRLHFNMKLAPFSGLAISDSPLTEWHPFATFPAVDGNGGSMIISDAGDWTKKTIMNPSTRYWVKGVPKTGVLSMATVFKRCVIVTTGSGIGPCLSFLTDPRGARTKCRLLWSTPSPLTTYGQTIVDAVQGADRDAVIIDTRAAGRPNMVQLTYQLYIESGAEAVFVISNPKLTRKIVYGMESRGVPAFGPIWDS